MCCRAHAKKITDTCQNDDKEKICKNFCCYDQKNNPFFLDFFFFVAIACSNKKM